MKKFLTTLCLFTLVACGSEATPDPAVEAGTNPETNVDAPKGNPMDSFYLEASPAGAIEVGALRGLADGAEVTVRGDVQEYAPVEGKAVLSLYDHALVSCDENPDDGCSTPWDFCCVDSEEIAKASALVEFRKDGAIVNTSLKDYHGMDHLSDVVITGTLHLDDAGNARIVASGLHVE